MIAQTSQAKLPSSPPHNPLVSVPRKRNFEDEPNATDDSGGAKRTNLADSRPEDNQSPGLRAIDSWPQRQQTGGLDQSTMFFKNDIMGTINYLSPLCRPIFPQTSREEEEQETYWKSKYQALDYEPELVCRQRHDEFNMQLAESLRSVQQAQEAAEFEAAQSGLLECTLELEEAERNGLEEVEALMETVAAKKKELNAITEDQRNTSREYKALRAILFRLYTLSLTPKPIRLKNYSSTKKGGSGREERRGE